MSALLVIYLSICAFQNLFILFAGLSDSLFQTAKIIILIHLLGYALIWISSFTFFMLGDGGSEWPILFATGSGFFSIPFIEMAIAFNFKNHVPDAPIFSSPKGKHACRIILETLFYSQSAASIGVVLFIFNTFLFQFNLFFD